MLSPKGDRLGQILTANHSPKENTASATISTAGLKDKK